MHKLRSAQVLGVAAAAVTAMGGAATSSASAATHPSATAAGTSPRTGEAVAAARARGFVPKVITLKENASDVPETTGGCITSGGVTECAHIKGQYNHVSSMYLTERVNGAGQWIAGDIVSPLSHSTPSPRFYYRSDGNYMPTLYGPTGTVHAGDWSFYALRLNANQTQTVIEDVILYVVA
jgi:hypothetical protein